MSAPARSRRLPSTKGRPSRADAPGRRKNVRLDQRKLDAVRRILGARTETEAIERAMDEVIFRERATSGMAQLVGRGGFTNVFDGEE